MDDVVIEFPNKAARTARDWISLESTMREVFAGASMEVSTSDEVVAALKERFDRYVGGESSATLSLPGAMPKEFIRDVTSSVLEYTADVERQACEVATRMFADMALLEVRVAVLQRQVLWLEADIVGADRPPATLTLLDGHEDWHDPLEPA